MNKAYDEALALIRRDSNAKLRELGVLKKRAEEQPELRKAVQKLEIESQINLPEVRWNLANGLGELLPRRAYESED